MKVATLTTTPKTALALGATRKRPVSPYILVATTAGYFFWEVMPGILKGKALVNGE